MAETNLVRATGLPAAACGVLERAVDQHRSQRIGRAAALGLRGLLGLCVGGLSAG